MMCKKLFSFLILNVFFCFPGGTSIHRITNVFDETEPAAGPKLSQKVSGFFHNIHENDTSLVSPEEKTFRAKIGLDSSKTIKRISYTFLEHTTSTNQKEYNIVEWEPFSETVDRNALAMKTTSSGICYNFGFPQTTVAYHSIACTFNFKSDSKEKTFNDFPISSETQKIPVSFTPFETNVVRKRANPRIPENTGSQPLSTHWDMWTGASFGFPEDPVTKQKNTFNAHDVSQEHLKKLRENYDEEKNMFRRLGVSCRKFGKGCKVELMSFGPPIQEGEPWLWKMKTDSGTFCFYKNGGVEVENYLSKDDDLHEPFFVNDPAFVQSHLEKDCGIKVQEVIYPHS